MMVDFHDGDVKANTKLSCFLNSDSLEWTELVIV